MRVRNKKTYYLKKKTLIEDNEGGKYSGFETTFTKIQANISPASGKLQAEIYGERLKYILNMLYDEDMKIAEGDGICVYVGSDAEPDYRVISIKNWSHKQIELEKIL
jgi:hypothetical protein